MTESGAKLEARGLTISFAGVSALRDVTLSLPAHKASALIGPSGCGKSTLLRAFNRMNEQVWGHAQSGEVLLDNQNIHRRNLDVGSLRRRVGMVFQRSNPFPKSVFENVAYGVRIDGIRDRRVLSTRVEKALTDAALWDEVKDRLDHSALSLSVGQQQRLCIARALAVEPEVLLMDEPASALDPIATARIEELINDLKSRYTLVIVTHNLQQAARISDRTAFFFQGELVESGPTEQIFTNPKDRRTEDYVTGKFG